MICLLLFLICNFCVFDQFLHFLMIFVQILQCKSAPFLHFLWEKFCPHWALACNFELGGLLVEAWTCKFDVHANPGAMWPKGWQSHLCWRPYQKGSAIQKQKKNRIEKGAQPFCNWILFGILCSILATFHHLSTTFHHLLTTFQHLLITSHHFLFTFQHLLTTCHYLSDYLSMPSA